MFRPFLHQHFVYAQFEVAQRIRIVTMVASPLCHKLSYQPTRVPEVVEYTRGFSSRPCTPAANSTVTPIFHWQETAEPQKVVYQNEKEPKQACIDGEMWPPIFEAENVRSARKMIPRDDDVFVCTYPKCGTTWIQHICSQLLSANYNPGSGKELSQTSPMIERMGAEYADKLQSPRLLKTHFAYYNCPKSDTAKYIFAARNPKDCLTSYYFHNKNFKIYDWANGKFDDFFNLFCSNNIAFGDYFDHLMSWLPQVGKPNVLFLKYEDMLEDLETAVVKIGEFIGGEAAAKVRDPETLAHIVAESRIDAMKKDQTRWFPGSALHTQTFIRKGTKGDWLNYFSKDQSDRIDEICRSRFVDTIAANWWKEDMAWSCLPEISITSPSGEEETIDSSGNCSSDEGFMSEEFDDMPSVSRRPSNAQHLDVPLYRGQGSGRRGSMDTSVTFGSVWTNLQKLQLSQMQNEQESL
uniref:Sulfotransfer_1 domain-containing protein n=1 Tax=Panagrellus redivivus TaxID=6233 RepID=A0A7E4UPI6_PANRE